MAKVYSVFKLTMTRSRTDAVVKINTRIMTQFMTRESDSDTTSSYKATYGHWQDEQHPSQSGIDPGPGSWWIDQDLLPQHSKHLGGGGGGGEPEGSEPGSAHCR
jgi:hypothetical protein